MTRSVPLPTWAPLWVMAMLLASGCSASPDRDRSDPLNPGPLAAQELQLRLLESKPGTVIRLAAGRFELTQGLLIGTDRVTLRGAGAAATTLSFKGQAEAGAGIHVTGDDVRLEGLAVIDTPGVGISSQGADRIIYRNLRVEWTGDPDPAHGAFGIQPVGSLDVLIDGVFVRGASDAGIQVAESRSVIVRKSRLEANVVGIEIVDSSRTDVFDNIVTGNTAGILVLNRPDSRVKDGRDIRIFDNQVFANNTPNFASGAALSPAVPEGTGITLIAARGVHVYRNQMSMNQSAHLFIAAYPLPITDPYFDPFPADIVVRDNGYGSGGNSPQGMLNAMYDAFGAPLPPIIWDGVTTHRRTEKAPSIAILEPPSVGFLDLGLARTPVVLGDANPRERRPRVVPVVSPEPVVVPQDPL